MSTFQGSIQDPVISIDNTRFCWKISVDFDEALNVAEIHNRVKASCL